MLVIDNVSVKYGDLKVLHDISLEVKEKEVVALLGSNGSGKTTLVNTITGLLKPSSGSIKFLNKRIDTLPSHEIVKIGIACVPEGRRIFPKLKVIENLRVGSYIPEARKRRKETLNWVFNIFPVLRERKNQIAGTLSGGEQQMLAIARALMSNPKLLILDEPTQGLAPLMVEKVFEVIKSLSDWGVTILLSEQNVHGALEIAHRAYILENGRVCLEGRSSDLLKSDFVKKAYLGM